MVTSWWIGQAGDLQELHSDGLSVSRTPDRRATAHALLSGRTRVDRALRSSRSWDLAWQWSQADDWDVLYELYDGQRGPGPWWWLDPTVRNYLSPDQATAGTAAGDSSAWAVLGGGEAVALTASLNDLHTTTSVRWSLPISPTQGVLLLPHSSGLRRPTGPGWQWTYWQRLFLSSVGDTSINGRLELVWYDSDGLVVSTSSSSYAAIPSGAYGRYVVTATAPAAAVTFEPRVRVDLSTILAGTATTINLGRAQLTQGPDDTVWRPGQGIPRVSITAHDDALNTAAYTSTSWNLVEVI